MPPIIPSLDISFFVHMSSSSSLFFFFFQAEDGIRDVAVTGVQTCALPIFNGTALAAFNAVLGKNNLKPLAVASPVLAVPARSGERRVGEEGRSRWAPYH